jgi:hypothetical protein
MNTQIGGKVCVWIGAAMALVHAAPINYEALKNYTFTTNANVVPTLNLQRYDHAYDYNVVGGGIAQNTAQTARGFDPFAPDSYNKNWPNAANANIYYWAIFNRPPQLVPIAVTKEQVNGLTLNGSPYNDSSVAGGANANVDASVTTLAAKNAAGSLSVNGNVPDPVAGERLFAMSYGQLTATANGANLRGVVTDAAGLVINNLAAPRGIGSTAVRTGAADPVSLAAFDSSGNLMSNTLLMVDQGEIDGWGLLDWESNALTLNADNGFFSLAIYPFTQGDVAGALDLTVVNGVVTFATTGTAFQSCQASAKSSVSSFSCTLPTLESWNYAYNSNGNMMSLEANFDDVGFTQAENTPEPGTLITIGLALVGGGLLRRRRRASAASTEHR